LPKETYIRDHLARLVSITYKKERQKSGISSKAINENLLHKPDK